MCAAGSLLASCCFLLQSIGHHEAASSSVEVEDFAIAAPGHSCLYLALRFLFAELFVDHVEEEVLGNRVITLRLECATYLPKEEDVLERCIAEDFLLTQNFGVAKFRT